MFTVPSCATVCYSLTSFAAGRRAACARIKMPVDQFEIEVETGNVTHRVRLDGVSEKSYQRIIDILSTQVKKPELGR